MKNRIFKITIVITLILVNIIVLKSAWTLSSNYPFDRIIINNRLTEGLNIFNKSPFYNAEIVEINGQLLKPKSATFKLFTEKIHSYKLKLIDESEIAINKNIEFNYNLFAFIFFMLIFGDIHLIWGIISHKLLNKFYISKYLSKFLIAFGIYFIGITLSIFTDFKLYIFQLILTSIFYILITVSIYLSFVKNKTLYYKIAKGISVIVFLFFVLLEYLSNFRFALLLLSFAVVFTIIITFYFIVRKMYNIKTSKRINYLSIYLTSFIAIIFPIIGFAGSNYIDFPIPVTFLSSTSILIPIFLGNNFINIFTNTYGRKSRYYSKIMIDFITTGIIAYLLHLMFKILNDSNPNYRLFIIILISTALVLLIRNYILKTLKNYLLSNKDKYSTSLQKLSEIATQPIDLSERFSRIYFEIYTTINVNHLYLCIYEPFNIEIKSSKYENFIKLIPEDTELAKNFRKSHFLLQKQSIITQAAFKRFVKEKSFDKKTEIAIPVISNTFDGMICAGQKINNKYYYQSDINYLSSASLIIYQMLENEMLFKNYIEKTKFENELDIASYLQLRLFPREFPEEQGLHISFFTRPYIKVTGDYFDYIKIDERKTAIIIGDVSGHGLPAAMIMMITASLFHTMFSEESDLDKIINEINDFFINRYSGMELVTLFAGVFDKEEKTLEYINAGHPHPIYLKQKDNLIKKITHKNLMVGVVDDPGYESNILNMETGDELILYTDGLTEIKKEHSFDDIGEKVIYDILEKKRQESIETKIEAFSEYIDKMGSDNIKDDITIIGIEIL